MSFFRSKNRIIFLGILLLLCGVLLYACAEAPQKRTLGGAAVKREEICTAKIASIATKNLQINIWG